MIHGRHRYPNGPTGGLHQTREKTDSLGAATAATGPSRSSVSLSTALNDPIPTSRQEEVIGTKTVMEETALQTKSGEILIAEDEASVTSSRTADSNELDSSNESGSSSRIESRLPSINKLAWRSALNGNDANQLRDEEAYRGPVDVRPAADSKKSAEVERPTSSDCTAETTGDSRPAVDTSFWDIQTPQSLQNSVRNSANVRTDPKGVYYRRRSRHASLWSSEYEQEASNRNSEEIFQRPVWTESFFRIEEPRQNPSGQPDRHVALPAKSADMRIPLVTRPSVQSTASGTWVAKAFTIIRSVSGDATTTRRSLKSKVVSDDLMNPSPLKRENPADRISHSPPVSRFKARGSTRLSTRRFASEPATQASSADARAASGGRIFKLSKYFGIFQSAKSETGSDIDTHGANNTNAQHMKIWRRASVYHRRRSSMSIGSAGLFSNAPKKHSQSQEAYVGSNIVEPEGPRFQPPDSANSAETPIYPNHFQAYKDQTSYFDLMSWRKRSSADGTIMLEEGNEHVSDSRNGYRGKHASNFTGQLHRTLKDRRKTSVRFEVDVPEHLASSPLCPRNDPSNRGRAAICPYHGSPKSLFPGPDGQSASDNRAR